MFTKFTILRKGLLIVSIPLLFQAVFVGILVQSARENARAQRWAVHTKQVIAKTEESYRRCLEANAAMRDLIVLEYPQANERLLREIALIPASIGELRDLVEDNKLQQSRVDELAREASSFATLLQSIARQVREQDRTAASRHLEEAAQSLARLHTMVSDLLAEETRLDQERMGQISRASARHFTFLFAGGAATIALTLSLAYLFLNRVVRRLDHLRDNTRRFAEGRSLSRPLWGRDELAQVDQAFREMASSLEAQKQENDLFVYSVSHELRSPLINLQGFSEELKHSARDLEDLFERDGVPQAVHSQGRKLLKQNIAESVHYIQAAVERLARIIDGLLRLSRAGRVHYEWRQIDVAAVVGRVVDALHDSSKEKNAEIAVHSLPDAFGDPLAIEQIFANLIGNAVKYLDPARPGRVEVGCLPEPEAEQGRHVYYVKDNGFGIPDAYHARVFTAFNRLHANTSSGEGIGLALVRRIVERHGGSIWMESAAGVGTTFFVALPSQLPERAPAEYARMSQALEA